MSYQQKVLVYLQVALEGLHKVASHELWVSENKYQRCWVNTQSGTLVPQPPRPQHQKMAEVSWMRINERRCAVAWAGWLWVTLATRKECRRPKSNTLSFLVRKFFQHPFRDKVPNSFASLRLHSIFWLYAQACAMKYTIRVVGSLLGIAGVWYYWSHRKQVWNKENCDTVILSFLSIVIVIQFTIFIPFHIFTHHPLLMPYSPLLYIPCRIKPYPQYLLSLKYP